MLGFFPNNFITNTFLICPGSCQNMTILILKKDYQAYSSTNCVEISDFKSNFPYYNHNE